METEEKDEPIEAQIVSGETEQLSVETPTTGSSGNHERWILFAIAGLIILLDQTSKYVVELQIPVYSFWAPWPELAEFFRFTHTTNTGAAFGILPSGSLLFAIFAVIVAGAIIYFNQTLEPGHKLMRLALGLQLGGAIGNLIDRLRQGYVTDFFDVGPVPIFNVADMAVVVGTFLLGFLLMKEERQAAKEADDHIEAETAIEVSETPPSSNGGTDH